MSKVIYVILLFLLTIFLIFYFLFNLKKENVKVNIKKLEILENNYFSILNSINEEKNKSERKINES
jgi:regulatory protein YycI of two-component signal transduction system YycFG